MGGMPTLPMVLPLYKTLQTHLKTTKRDYDGPQSGSIRQACQAGLEKLDKHFNITLGTKLPLLGAGTLMARVLSSSLTELYTVLHPSMRISYFENTEQWSPPDGGATCPQAPRRPLQGLCGI